MVKALKSSKEVDCSMEEPDGEIANMTRSFDQPLFKGSRFPGLNMTAVTDDIAKKVFCMEAQELEAKFIKGEEVIIYVLCI